MLAGFFGVAVVIIGFSDVIAEDTECGGRAQVEYKAHLGERYSDAAWLMPHEVTGIPGRLSVADVGKQVRNFRVRLEHVAGGPKHWQLTVADPKTGQAWQHFGPEDFQNTEFVWSRRFPGDSALFQLQAPSGAQNFLRRTQYIRVRSDGVGLPYYSVQQPGSERWQPLFCAAGAAQCEGLDWDLRRLGDGVGFAVFSYAQKVWSCTGFLVSRSLFITNWHCGGSADLDSEWYWNDDVLRSLIIDFSWDGDGNSNEHGWDGNKVYQDLRVIADKDLDFAIFRVKPLGQNFGSPAPLKLNTLVDYRNVREVALLHHPMGMAKQVTKKDCVLIDQSFPSWIQRVEGTDFTHKCDTEGGSSGAPVYDRNGAVIGLHHEGFTRDRESGQCDYKNKAVRIDRIWHAIPEALRRQIAEQR